MIERLRMKLNRSRRDAWILERPTSPTLPPKNVAAAQGALGLLGSVSIAHIGCPLCSARRLTSGCLLEYGGAMKEQAPKYRSKTARMVYRFRRVAR
jgi:hypothetical protein